ncbi:MAG: PDZ domain-containing protein [Candidatus Marinimicrobia bacterium]|nr:PDZ domain-containing protein [Candidatus Neomarinimicrobiota bacterium]
MPRLLIALILCIGLIQAQTVVKKIITLDDDNNEKTIKIERFESDSTLKIIINRDGEIEEMEIPIGSIHDQAIKDKLAKLNITMDDFHFADFDQKCLQPEKGGWLGVKVQSLTDQLRKHFGIKHDGGVLISEVIDDSPAKTAKLKAGDIILKIDDTNISSTTELQRVIHRYEPETMVKVNIIRDRKEKNLRVKLGESESPQKMTWFSRGATFLDDHDFDQDFEHFDTDMRGYYFKKPRVGGKHPDCIPFDDDLRNDVDNLKKELEELKKTLREKSN